MNLIKVRIINHNADLIAHENLIKIVNDFVFWLISAYLVSVLSITVQYFGQEKDIYDGWRYQVPTYMTARSITSRSKPSIMASHSLL